jgi:hypothetical protein
MPRFKHDCKNCTFLGEWQEYDLYHCLQGLNDPTLVARYSDEPSNYRAGLPSIRSLAMKNDEDYDSPIVVAYRRAEKLGLQLREKD